MKRIIAALMILCLTLAMLPVGAFAAGKTYIEVIKDNAPLRSGKGEKYSVVVHATKGTVLEAVDSSLNIYLHRWYKVNTAGGAAWIYSGNVKKVSASGYTTAIKLSKSDVQLNLKGTKTVKLNAVCKYKGRTDTNVTWSTSDSRVAKVNAPGSVTAVGIGKCTITAKHRIFGTTASCTVSVIESRTLSVPSKEQSNGSCCSGASAWAVLRSLKGSSFKKTDLQLFKEMGSTGVVYKVRNIINKYLGSSTYAYRIYKSQSAYEKAVIKSIEAGYPVIALVKITNNTYIKYRSNGHFTCLSGYKINPNGSVQFKVTDSYRTGKNGGSFRIPAKTFFSYSKSHGNPYYLILKK